MSQEITIKVISQVVRARGKDSKGEKVRASDLDALRVGVPGTEVTLVPSPEVTKAMVARVISDIVRHS